MWKQVLLFYTDLAFSKFLPSAPQLACQTIGCDMQTITDFPEVVTRSWQECQASCNLIPQCTHWAWRTDSWHNCPKNYGKKNGCYRKISNGTLIILPCQTDGLMCGPRKCAGSLWTNDVFILEGDMVLNKRQKKELEAAVITGTSDGMTVSRNPSESTFRNAKIDKDSRWPNGIIYFSFDENVPKSRKKTVRNAVSDLQSKLSGCLKFKEKNDGKRVIVWRDNVEGSKICLTDVGYQYDTNDKHWFYLADKCKKGNIQHEFLHAAGLWHTQMRWDRDEYVTIIDDNIIEGKKNNFCKYNPSVVTHYGLPYDYKSIMHYPKNAFGKGGKVTIKTKDRSKQNVIGNRISLSKGDIQLVSHMYDCFKGCKTTRGPRLAKCVFPFKYNGVSYNGCTKISAESNWCATKVKDNGDMMTKDDWGYFEDMCPIHRDCKTTDNKRCVFPFIYKGQRYNSCTSKESKHKWCATKVKANAQYIQKKFGRCGSSCP